jgi:DNA-binding GntR family transcriptional regulator
VAVCGFARYGVGHQGVNEELTMQIPKLAYQIAEFIKAERLPEGTRLPGRKLAEQFRVSRSPIERALRLLEGHQVVSYSDKGYIVCSLPTAIVLEELGAKRQSTDELLYLRLADDHATGHLPEKISENELIRRYGASRATILGVLQRAAGEGWAERLPGRGWAFVPLLTPDLTYEQICRYRIVIEPAAIMEPTFVLNRPAVEACHAEQVALFAGQGLGHSPVEVFEIGSKFHRVVLNCSRNPFFISGLDRANRVRRLVEYKKTLSSPHWIERCREHARIAELLLVGDREAAARLMRNHLEEGMREKSLSL